VVVASSFTPLHRYNTASSASSAASASPAAFRDGRTDRLLPCDISVGVCPGILSKLMPYHAGLSTKGLVWVGLGRSGLVWSGSQGELGAGLRLCRSHVSLHFPTSNFSQNGRPLHQRRLFWAAASPRCDRCKLSRWLCSLLGDLCRQPSLPAPRSFHNFNHLLSARSASMCLHAPLYAPLCASLTHPTPNPSQGGTSDSNGRVRTSRYRPRKS